MDRSRLLADLQAGASALDLQLGDTACAQLLDYLQLLQKWNKVYNLTAVREPQRMLSQHLLDSLAAIPAVQGANKVLDVGAGGGLPGIVFATWALQAQAATRFTLVDTVQKKTAFLTQVKAELGLTNLEVLNGRVEALQLTPEYDRITSRAFAELADFVNWSGHLLAENGQFVALKGVFPQAEMDALPSAWVVSKVQALQVPQLDAERHLIWIGRAGQGARAHESFPNGL